VPPVSVDAALAIVTSRRSLIADIAGMNISYTADIWQYVYSIDLLVGSAVPNRNAWVTEEQ
jgi:hypothetical protein